MHLIYGQFNKLILTIALLIPCATALSQGNQKSLAAQRANFHYLLGQANISFTFPQGFKETLAPNNEDFTFDYAIELPGQDFEIWFQVRTLKRNSILYLETLNDKNRTANPDSLYVDLGRAHAIAFSGGNDYIVRNIPPEVLENYNADAGKTYLLNLLDMPETKHYKYALLITIQKHHVGTLVAVCFTNEKNAEFFKNIKKAQNSIKFKPLK